jgi:hypothetical protein
VEKLRVCYQAGPTGYVLYWQLAELGVQCEVIAPSLVPVQAGDRVKTDRRDSEKLARSYRSGNLTAVWVPDEGSEAFRDSEIPRRNRFYGDMLSTCPSTLLEGKLSRGYDRATTIISILNKPVAGLASNRLTDEKHF